MYNMLLEELAKKVDKIENHRLVSETEIAAWNAKAEVADVEQALKDAKEYTDQEIAKVNEDMDALEGRVDSLEEKVGHDVDGNNPATGLFLEVDQAKELQIKLNKKLTLLKEEWILLKVK